MSEETCAERIDNNLNSRLESFNNIFERVHGYSSVLADEANDEWAEYPLDIEQITVVKILLSTGGPADWFECKVDAKNHGEILSIDYHFADWWDHASVSLLGEQFEIARQFCEYFTESLYAG